MGAKETLRGIAAGGILGALGERIVTVPEVSQVVTEILKNNPEAFQAIMDAITTAITTADSTTAIAALATAVTTGVLAYITRDKGVVGGRRLDNPPPVNTDGPGTDEDFGRKSN